MDNQRELWLVFLTVYRYVVLDCDMSARTIIYSVI